MTNDVNCPNNRSVNYQERNAHFEALFLMDIATFERFCYPTWLAIGIPGSILTIIIWSRKSMRRNGSFAASIFQATLGIVDLCFLTVYMLFYLHINKIVPIMDSPMCRIYPLITYILQYITPLLNLSIILERYIAVKYPFNNRKFCGRSKTSAISVLIICTGISTAFSCSSAFFFYMNDSGKRCVHILETSDNPYVFYWTVIVEILIFGIIPLICLIFNILLAVILKQLTKKQLQPTVTVVRTSIGDNGQTDFFKSQRNSALSSTITLVCVSFFLIFAHFSVAVSMIFTYSLERGDICLLDEQIGDDPQWKKYFFGYKIKSIIESICFSHSALKFFVYFATSQMFRKEFYKLIRCCNRDQDKTLISVNTKKSSNPVRESNNIQDLELVDSYPKVIKKHFMSAIFSPRGIRSKTSSETRLNYRQSRQTSKTVFNEYGKRVLVA